MWKDKRYMSLLLTEGKMFSSIPNSVLEFWLTYILKCFSRKRVPPCARGVRLAASCTQCIFLLSASPAPWLIYRTVMIWSLFYFASEKRHGNISCLHASKLWVAFLEKVVYSKLLLGQNHIISGNSVNIQKVQEYSSL